MEISRGVSQSVESCRALFPGRGGLTGGIERLSPDVEALIFNIGVLTGDVETLTADGGGLTFNVGALTFDVGALIFDVGGLTFDVFGAKFSCRTLKINHLREMALKRPFLPIIHLPTPICRPPIFPVDTPPGQE